MISVPTPMPKPSVEANARNASYQRNGEEDEREVERVAVQVLEDEREARSRRCTLARASGTAQAGGDQKNAR